MAILLHQFPGQGIKPVISLLLAPHENKMQCKETYHFPALRPWESHSAWPWVGFEMIGTRRLVALFDKLFIVCRLCSWLLPVVRGSGLYVHTLSYCFTIPHHSIGAASVLADARLITLILLLKLTGLYCPLEKRSRALLWKIIFFLLWSFFLSCTLNH